MCRNEASITLRGFLESSSNLSKELGNHKENELKERGELIREKSDAVYTKSSVRTSINLSENNTIDKKFFELIDRWGGVNNIIRVIKLYDIEHVEIDIVIYTFEYGPSSYTLGNDSICIISKLGGDLSFSAYEFELR
jgi:hypothetical protein